MKDRIPLFGSALRDLRESKGWSQPELVRQLERKGYTLHVSTINKWELGERYPSSADVIAYLEVSLGLIEDEATELIDALSLDYFLDMLAQYEEAKAGI